MTSYDMKTAAVTNRLDPELEELLDEVCRKTGQSRSEVVCDAVRRQLTLRLVEEARRKVIPFAEAQGVYTDEDVFWAPLPDVAFGAVCGNGTVVPFWRRSPSHHLLLPRRR
jgi:predicted transcriptional regulator